MNSVKKAFKIIFFGAILLVLAAAYRMFGEKKDAKQADLFRVDSAEADVPPDPGPGDCVDCDVGTSVACGDT